MTMNDSGNQAGVSFAELLMVLCVLSVLSFALFTSASKGLEHNRSHLGSRQAQTLAQLLNIDFELAQAQGEINHLAHIFGFKYSRQWPRIEPSFFSQTELSWIQSNDIEMDETGCASGEWVFKPCWRGLQVWVEYNGAVFRPRAINSHMVHTDYSADFKAFQNHAFSQRSGRAVQWYEEVIHDD